MAVSLLCAGLVVVTAPAGAAEPLPAPTMRATSLPMGQTNGTVQGIAYAAGKVFVGGNFTAARPAGAAAGVDEVPRSYVAAFDAATGAIDPTFSHVLTNTYDGSAGVVHAVTASPDGSRVYIAGDFNNVDGVKAEHIAAFDAGTGALIPSFGAEGVNGRAQSIAVTATTVYVGGVFTKSSYRVRTRAAAFTLAGKATAWAPTFTGSATTGQPASVLALSVSPDGTIVHAGGTFDVANGANQHGIAAVDSTVGASVPWPTALVPLNSYVTGLTTDATQLYVSARDDKTGSLARFEGVKALDPNTGALKWFDNCYGDSFQTLVLNDRLYVTTHSHDCSRIGGWPESNPRVYASIYVVDTRDGSLLPFFPRMNGDANVPGSLNNTRTLATDGTNLFVGGGWTNVGGVPQANTARFSPNGNGAAPEKPYASAKVDSNGAITLRWRTVADADDDQLTYRVYRTYKTTSPIYEATARSVFWIKTGMTFTDPNPPAGTTYYRISVSDGRQEVFSVNTATLAPGAPAGTYQSAVTTDAPTSYWRLSDGLSSTASDSTGNGKTGTYYGNPGRFAGSQFPSDSAVSFDGVDDRVVGTTSQFDPTAFTAEVWVKTTSTRGGRILGHGDSRTGTSNSTDRMVYLTNDGRVAFGVRVPTDPVAITSTTSINDGAWHHVAATQDAYGMRLYVDGALAASNDTVTDGLHYTGYWRVGQDAIAPSWPDAPLSTGLAGVLDEAAFYPHALTAAQVARHVALKPAP